MPGITTKDDVNSPRFSAILTNVRNPYVLPDPPFSGAYQTLGVVFYIGRLRSLKLCYDDLVGDLQKERRALYRQIQELALTYQKEWENKPGIEAIRAYDDYKEAEWDLQVKIDRLDNDTVRKLKTFLIADFIEVEVERDENGELVHVEVLYYNEDGERCGPDDDGAHPNSLLSPDDPQLEDKIDLETLRFLVRPETREEVQYRSFNHPLSRTRS